jgi:hypothetical protein
VSQETTNRSFDELASGLASGTLSRGKALRLMGAALVGGTLASLGIREAGADPPGCKRNGKNCKRNTQCCSGTCSSGTCADAPTPCGSNGATCTGNTDCCSGRCASGVCAEPCPSGRVLLSNGTCAVPCGSPAACTACGNPLGAVCFGTVDDGSFCGGRVVGACGPDGSCPTGQFCSFGDCVVACEEGASQGLSAI